MNASTALTMPGPETLRWAEVLVGGMNVQIRPLLPTDALAEREFIEDLSPQSRRFRFLGQVAHPGQALIEQLTNIDFHHDIALAATVPEFGRERIVGVGRYCAERDHRRCECAVAVADDWRRRGLGTVLMRHLIDVARERGIEAMYSIDAAENADMAELAQHLGFHSQLDPEDASRCIHTLGLGSA
jgi:GNAT superfamily N-acetyltransferase